MNPWIFSEKAPSPFKFKPYPPSIWIVCTTCVRSQNSVKFVDILVLNSFYETIRQIRANKSPCPVSVISTATEYMLSVPKEVLISNECYAKCICWKNGICLIRECMLALCWLFMHIPQLQATATIWWRTWPTHCWRPAVKLHDRKKRGRRTKTPDSRPALAAKWSFLSSHKSSATGENTVNSQRHSN